MPQSLAVSQYDRYIVYLGEWSWYDGKATGSCLFSDRREAIRWARFNASSRQNWDEFPDAELKYPYEERDGTEDPTLNPLFVAKWEGGYSRVTKMEICDEFDWYAKNIMQDGTPQVQSWDIDDYLHSKPSI